MNAEFCLYCGEQIALSDDIINKRNGGIAHFECSETEDPDELD